MYSFNMAFMNKILIRSISRCNPSLKRTFYIIASNRFNMLFHKTKVTTWNFCNTRSIVNASPSKVHHAGTPSVTNQVTVYNIHAEKGIVDLIWSTGETYSYSSIFLRDCCRCSKCFNSESKQRVIDTCNDIPLNIIPEKVDVSPTNVKLTWPDGHETVFTHEFLWQRRNAPIDADSDNIVQDISCIKPVLWNSKEMEGKVPTFDFNTILNDDAKKYSWFKNLRTYGVTLFTGAEKKVGELEKLKHLFGGYYKSTHYGDTFQVVFKPNPSSLAYTTDAILPHVDLPHYCYQPGIQVLHCIQQVPGKGAESVFVDGFHTANYLKETDPESFDLLTTHGVKYRDIGTDYYGEFETFYERPLIGLKKGEIHTVSYSNWLRDYFMSGTAEEIQKFYKAYYMFTNLINKSENALTFKLQEGEIVVVDNLRILHGRAEYKANGTSSGRFLDGCYFDWDPLYWSMRPIKRKLDDQLKRTKN